jgi:thiamine biosynthesis lipoprotein
MDVELDYSFHAMGSDVRLLIGRPLVASAPSALEAADRERAFVLEFAGRLSRFKADSELSALNRDPRRVVPASRLLRAAIAAGVWAAERSDGLVEPTLLPARGAAGGARAGRGPASPAPGGARSRPCSPAGGPQPAVAVAGGRGR